MPVWSTTFTVQQHVGWRKSSELCGVTSLRVRVVRSIVRHSAWQTNRRTEGSALPYLPSNLSDTRRLLSAVVKLKIPLRKYLILSKFWYDWTGEGGGYIEVSCPLVLSPRHSCWSAVAECTYICYIYRLLTSHKPLRYFSIKNVDIWYLMRLV